MENIESSEDALQRLKAFWLEKLKAAELNVKLAQDRLQAVIENLQPGDLNVAEGLSPFRQASQAEVEALREYDRVLRILRDLAEHDRIPDEPASGGDQEQ